MVIDALDKPGVQYFVGGSLASSLYGMGRSTYDADIVAALKKEHVLQFIEALDSSFHADEAMILDAIRRTASFNLVHGKTAFKLDVFIPKAQDFDRSQFERRVEQSFEGIQKGIYFASIEDTVLAKLERYRLGNEVSERQWNDVVEVLKTQRGSLDGKMLKQWAAKLGVADLLARALKESEPNG